MSALLGSASGLFRSLVCPASVQLPDLQVRKASWDAAADRGSALHTYVELAPEDPEAALAAIPESLRAEASTIPIRACAGSKTSPALREVALIHNVTAETVRRVECRDRDYGEMTDDDVPGTFDVVLVGHRTAEVWDYKFGKRKVSAEDNDQLLDGALKVVRHFAPKATHVVAGIQQFVHQGRGKQRRLVPKDNYVILDRFEIDDHERKKQKAYRLAEEVKAAIATDEVPPVFKGAHCYFCPAKNACPAHVGEKLYRIKMRKHNDA